MEIRELLRPVIPKLARRWRYAILSTQPLADRTCPICSYTGRFDIFGRPPRVDARCPKCESLERHRLFWLWFERHNTLEGPVLHFAPERPLEQRFRKLLVDYRTADFFADADLRLNIEQLDLPDSSIKTVICNHVLEHVDDRKALAEMSRVLTDDGVLICSVPIIEGWAETYENNNVRSDSEREVHFGQHDHVRYYGRDFRDRLKGAGFNSILEHTAQGSDVVKYGLMRGDKFFECHK